MRQKLVQLKLSWDWRHPGVREVWQVMGPATLSSGMLQINVFTDLFFASGLLGAAAGAGAMPICWCRRLWVDFQCVVGSSSADVFPPDGSARSSGAGGTNPSD